MKPTVRRWIGTRRGRYYRTLIVAAASRKEAQEKFSKEQGLPLDTIYYAWGPTKVVREDKAKKP